MAAVTLSLMIKKNTTKVKFLTTADLAEWFRLRNAPEKQAFWRAGKNEKGFLRSQRNILGVYLEANAN